MELKVLIAHRKESYENEHGLEALDTASEYDYDVNPDYIHGKEKEARDSGDFSAVEIVTFEVDEDQIFKMLYPNRDKKLDAKIVD